MKTKRILISMVVAVLMLCMVAPTVSASVRAESGQTAVPIAQTSDTVGTSQTVGATTWTVDPITPFINDPAGKTTAKLEYTSAYEPRIAFYSAAMGNLYYAQENGGKWFFTLIDTTGQKGYVTRNLDLALAKNNRPWISYCDVVTGYLRCAHQDANGHWYKETVDTGKAVGYSNSIAIGLDGQPRISYYQDPHLLKYAYRTASGKWVKETVYSGGIFYGAGTSIAINPKNGYPAISYFDNQVKTGGLRYAWKNPATNLWVREKADSTPLAGRESSLAFTSTGAPRISYYDMNKGDVKYTAKSGNTWYWVRLITTPRDGTSTSLVLSKNGLPRIAMRDPTNSKTMFLWKDTSSTAINKGWWIMTVDSQVQFGCSMVRVGGMTAILSTRGTPTNSLHLMWTTRAFN